MEQIMKITIKIKPILVTASTRDALMRKLIGSKYHQNDKAGYGLYIGDGAIKVYNIHKINAKYKHDAIFKSGPRKGQKKPSVKVRDKQWIAYVYIYDTHLLKLANKKVKQQWNNYIIF